MVECNISSLASDLFLCSLFSLLDISYRKMSVVLADELKAFHISLAREGNATPKIMIFRETKTFPAFIRLS